MRRLMGVLLAAAAAGAMSGCVVMKDEHGNTHLVLLDGPEPVGHVDTVSCHHHDSCGHYWYNGSWYVYQGHRHGPSCGHYYHNGRWVLAGAVNVSEGHVCSYTCNHYHMDGRWYAIRNHHHGYGCGHTLRGGVWIGVGF